MNQELILKILLEYSPFGMDINHGIERVFYTNKIIANIGTKLIKVITGFRRSGKSYTLKFIINYLISKGVNKGNIMYINLEDDRLYGFRKIEILRFIFETYLQKINPKGKIYLFFDEVQLIPGWESFIRTLYEKNQEIEIFITGSNSDLLSSEISSSLAGRCIEFTIYPLDFKEFLSFKGVNIKNEIEYLKNELHIKQLFDEYLIYGGLPEITEFKNNIQKIEYLKGVFNKIIIDDIIKRFKIRNIEIIEILNKFILSNTGQILSLKNIINGIKSYGYNINSMTLNEYIDYIKKGFIFFDLRRINWKTKGIFDNNKKYYSIDLGIRECQKINIDNDYSKKIESLIFFKLLKKGNDLYYGQDDNGKEIDFIEKQGDKYNKYQATINIGEENKDRELGNFVLSSKYLSGNNILLSNLNDDFLEYKGIKIKNINYIRFLIL